LLYGHTHENLRNCASDWPDCTSAERHEQTNIFYFRTALGTLYKDLRRCYCCRRHKFVIKTLSFNIQYVCLIYRDM